MSTFNASKFVNESVDFDNPEFGNMLVSLFGGVWRNSTVDEDKKLHIDIVYTDKNGREVPIDIKNMNSVKRGLPRNKDYQWIQVTTKVGTDGALFGKSMYFGFLNDNGRLLTSLENVRVFYDKVIDKNDVRKHNPECENILYQRCYRKDGVYYETKEVSFLIRWIDLYYLSHTIFPDGGKRFETLSGSDKEWIDFYCTRIAEEYRKKLKGEENCYNHPNEIYKEYNVNKS